MKILMVLPDKEVQAHPSAYLKTVRYLKDKYPALIVKITDRCGIAGDVELNRCVGLGLTPTSGDGIDMIIVSNGHRLPNFSLFESAYAEYLFTKKPVLNCSMCSLVKQIETAGNRDRRFGK